LDLDFWYRRGWRHLTLQLRPRPEPELRHPPARSHGYVIRRNVGRRPVRAGCICRQPSLPSYIRLIDLLRPALSWIGARILRVCREATMSPAVGSMQKLQQIPGGKKHVCLAPYRIGVVPPHGTAWETPSSTTTFNNENISRGRWHAGKGLYLPRNNGRQTNRLLPRCGRSQAQHEASMSII
jgi:hypothetical protein